MKLLRDYYRAGAHIYEFSQGRGRRRAVVALAETPQGDGAVLWQEHTPYPLTRRDVYEEIADQDC